jgi:hypothetical protein
VPTHSLLVLTQRASASENLFTLRRARVIEAFMRSEAMQTMPR